MSETAPMLLSYYDKEQDDFSDIMFLAPQPTVMWLMWLMWLMWPYSFGH
jgi:hypothetical protein